MMLDSERVRGGLMVSAQWSGVGGSEDEAAHRRDALSRTLIENGS